MTPSSRRLAVRGLTLHLLTWRPPPGVPPHEALVLLVHGFADCAGSWSLVAPDLAREGFAVVAPDLRGFGQSDWVGAGGYYHFPDYVGDLDALVEQLAPERLFLVGHSMGGVVASLYAGSRPERVEKLALLEGVGGPSTPPDLAPDRFTRWLNDLRHEGGRRPPGPMRGREAVLERLKRQHPEVDPAVLASLVDHLAHPATEDPEGPWLWRFDPLHRTTSPMTWAPGVFAHFAGRARCPTLSVSGGPTGYHPDDEDQRLEGFADLRRCELEAAGHMMHWTKPADLSKLLVGFLKSPPFATPPVRSATPPTE
ncbi:MAG TPA: alpha/beta hydrolase [Polyangiaceae bacterium]|nr:alpha/beta hydrolase [Polyangiaceae bacterium]